MIKRTSEIIQEWDKTISRCSVIKQVHKIYFLGILIYKFVDDYKESLRDEKQKIGF
jgi:hypothetical protein